MTEENLNNRLMLLNKLNDTLQNINQVEIYREDLGYDKATLFEKLGAIHHAMGHMGKALKYFEKGLELTKELYESNLRNTNLLEDLAISYYKLAMINKVKSNIEKGKEYFSQWKDIISFLVEKLPQVPRYRE